MTREEKNFIQWLYWIGKNVRRKGLPYFKNGTRVTVDQYYSILRKVMREKEEQDRMPYEIKSKWQKKRSLRQQRSIQQDTLSTPILP